MYQVVGVSCVLRYFGTLAVFVFLFIILTPWLEADVIHYGMSVENANRLFKYALLSVTISIGVFYILGQTKIFPLICKLPFVSDKFPPIDGIWDMETKSNWSRIQYKDNEAELHSTHGSVKIISRLLYVKITFDSNNCYSESRTLYVSVRPSDSIGIMQLNYIYRNYTLLPVAGDTNIHNGAAIIFLKKKCEGLIMVGTYFTDRNWVNGMNTAGTVSFKKRSSK